MKIDLPVKIKNWSMEISRSVPKSAYLSSEFAFVHDWTSTISQSVAKSTYFSLEFAFGHDCARIARGGNSDADDKK
ncbi:hypothetical protein PGTUg99_032837 [Puccinia graminis f. sp. tritici]|uniref:Uncharacterized protein n=1 Tax=Puccinia graminis f. sp. tritici TaxID=56615 RepID=A0A5B0LVA5_PUCGR|nr:hypothetical protein PGTUg99_032837 [Puccinia graminis f. sp. tritici]